MVVGPQADLAEGDAVVGIRVGDARFEGAVPRFAHREDRADERSAGGGEIAATAHVERHRFNGFAVPGSFFRIRLVGAGPRGHEADVDARILAAEQFGNLLRGLDQFRRVARLGVIQHALAEHDDAVPWATDQVGLFLEMQIEAGAADGFEAHGEIEPGLVGEDFEERGHAALFSIVQISDGFGAVVARGGAGAEHEAVADEENRLGFGRTIGGGREREQGGESDGEEAKVHKGMSRVSDHMPQSIPRCYRLGKVAEKIGKRSLGVVRNGVSA